MSFQDVESAVRARSSLNAQLVPQLASQVARPVRVDFAEVKEEEKKEAEVELQHMKDVSVKGSSAVVVPGLTVVTEFVTEEEEQKMVQEADAREWERRKVRRVQQFGFEFAFAVRNVDTTAPIDPLPDLFRQIAHRISYKPEV